MYRVEDYPQIKNNFYLTTRNAGASKKLKGDVGIIVCLMMRRPTDFPEAEKAEFHKALCKAGSWLEAEAKKYGTYLKLRYYYFRINVPQDADPRDGYKLMRDFFHRDSMDSIQEYYEERMKMDEMPFILVFDERARSFAMEQFPTYNSRVDEISVVFRDYGGKFSWGTIAHELLHQFGANDLYYPDAVEKCAKRYLKNSIMGINGDRLDDLSAYLVGIKDTVSAESYYFLKETMWMTKELYSKAVKEAWKK